MAPLFEGKDQSKIYNPVYKSLSPILKHRCFGHCDSRELLDMTDHIQLGPYFRQSDSPVQ